ncbi:MAG TPA: hypothetical protein VNM91_03420 [Dehalococcoidia bacterium]|nr:hypothetical protein [Dehalococcoidia bacterium]
MQRLIASVTLVVVALAAACGGGDGNDEPARTPTPDTFDPRALTALVIRPDDLALPPIGVTWNPEATNGISFQSSFGDQSLYMQNSVTRMRDRAIFEEQSVRLRRALSGLVGPESNFDVPGADRAYIYRGTEPPQLTTVAFLDIYIVLVSVQSLDGSRPEAALDEAQIRRYTETVFRRLEAYLADPDSVTPVAIFLTAAPSPPADTTPVPTPPP